jgi:hypothetical protein
MRISRLFSETVSVEELGVAEKDAMYALLAENYENVNRACFEADLFEKDCAIVLRDAQDQALRGFSTQKVMQFHVDGQPLRAVFSGDTIIARSHWGEQELGRAWSHFVAELRAEEPEIPLYWFLISKGYRTYLFLPLFFHQFFPRYDQVTPARAQEILDALAGTRYPDSYVRESGLIVFPESHGNLSHDLAEIPAHRLRSPHVRFFLSRNPRYAEGHELACLAEISAQNMRSYASRMLSESAGKAAPPEPSRIYA